MSYGKKDEDVDGAILKVDRTAVFQEGVLCGDRYAESVLTHLNSSSFQLLPYIAAKMSYITHQNRPPAIYGGGVPFERSNGPFFWNLQVVSK